uniref:Uncharacterized protein n=1 Tax=Knipowitschia caucasica TaxID=637954 RepID=A0AAV2JLK5_KNICA
MKSHYLHNPVHLACPRQLGSEGREQEDSSEEDTEHVHLPPMSLMEKEGSPSPRGLERPRREVAKKPRYFTSGEEDEEDEGEDYHPPLQESSGKVSRRPKLSTSRKQR